MGCAVCRTELFSSLTSFSIMSFKDDVWFYIPNLKNFLIHIYRTEMKNKIHSINIFSQKESSLTRVRGNVSIICLCVFDFRTIHSILLDETA